MKQKWQNFADFFIDTETFGLKDNAVITSIAVASISIDVSTKTGRIVSLYEELNVKMQQRLEREIEAGTLAWAFDNYGHYEVVDMLSERRRQPRAVCRSISKFFRQYARNDFNLFQRSKPFDTNKLESLYEQCGLVDEVPWKYYQLHEVRSYLYGALGSDYNVAVPLTPVEPHHALFDAYRDALQVMTARELRDGTITSYDELLSDMTFEVRERCNGREEVITTLPATAFYKY